MGDKTTIAEFYAQDHDRLDDLFKTFQRLKRSDFAGAKAVFEAFHAGLQRHIIWEEEVLFPLWEGKIGQFEGGPTSVMRAEHRQIAAQLEAIHRKVAGQNPDSDREEQALVDLLGAHNMKEERVLYPAIDQVITPADRPAVFSKMEQIPEGRHRASCGSRTA